MKFSPVFILALLFLFGCTHSKSKILEGDLYFKLISLSTFEFSELEIKKIEKLVSSGKPDTLTKQEVFLLDHYKFLVSNQLLRSPFIMLKSDNEEVKILFLSKQDFNIIKRYSLDMLLKENKKVRIKAEVKKVPNKENSVYKVLKLIDVNKIDGTTDWKK